MLVALRAFAQTLISRNHKIFWIFVLLLVPAITVAVSLFYGLNLLSIFALVQIIPITIVSYVAVYVFLRRGILWFVAGSVLSAALLFALLVSRVVSSHRTLKIDGVYYYENGYITARGFARLAVLALENLVLVGPLFLILVLAFSLHSKHPHGD